MFRCPEGLFLQYAGSRITMLLPTCKDGFHKKVIEHREYVDAWGERASKYAAHALPIRYDVGV